MFGKQPALIKKVLSDQTSLPCQATSHYHIRLLHLWIGDGPALFMSLVLTDPGSSHHFQLSHSNDNSQMLLEVTSFFHQHAVGWNSESKYFFANSHSTTPESELIAIRICPMVFQMIYSRHRNVMAVLISKWQAWRTGIYSIQFLWQFTYYRLKCLQHCIMCTRNLHRQLIQSLNWFLLFSRTMLAYHMKKYGSQKSIRKISGLSTVNLFSDLQKSQRLRMFEN